MDKAHSVDDSKSDGITSWPICSDYQGKTFKKP